MTNFMELIKTEAGSAQVWELLIMIGGTFLVFYVTHIFINILFKDIITKYVGKEKAKKQKKYYVITMYTVVVLSVTTLSFVF